jgi:hypothetical protein
MPTMTMASFHSTCPVHDCRCALCLCAAWTSRALFIAKSIFAGVLPFSSSNLLHGRSLTYSEVSFSIFRSKTVNSCSSRFGQPTTQVEREPEKLKSRSDRAHVFLYLSLYYCLPVLSLFISAASVPPQSSHAMSASFATLLPLMDGIGGEIHLGGQPPVRRIPQPDLNLFPPHLRCVWQSA